MSDTAALESRRSRLTPQQRAALEARLKGASSPDEANITEKKDVIVQHPSRDYAPLSFAQERLWFLWRLNPRSSAYHLNGGLRFTGVLDSEILRTCLHALVRRHESLRTVFRENESGSPEQFVLPEFAIDFPQLDFCGLEESEREKHLQEIRRTLYETPYNLTEGPLLRAALVKVDAQEHQLLISMHHIISDAWSIQLILEEMAEYYSSHLLQDCPPNLVEQQPIRYTDYVHWQRHWLAGDAGSRQLNWWKQQLGEDHPALSLSVDRPRNAGADHLPGCFTLLLPENLVAGLRHLAKAHGATLFISLLTAFQILLFRHSGQRDIRVGVPFANRNRLEVAKLVGFFVNTQVLRLQIDGRSLLQDLLTQGRDRVLGAQANQDLPFDRLVQALRPERSLSTSPLFQVMFNYVRMDRHLGEWPGLTVSRLSVGEYAAQFELTLEICEHCNGEVEASFRYAGELFHTDTIRRMAGHYLNVLAALVEHPEAAVDEIDLLSGAERKALLDMSVNERLHSDMTPVHCLFERQALLRPDAIALTFADQQLSYAELNNRANRLAHHLIRLGVRPETKVGIAMERSVEMVVGLLGILKAGGAYLPLDPEYPQDRLAYIVEDSGIGLLLLQSHLNDEFCHGKDVRLLRLDEVDLSEELAHNPALVLHGENLAYVIYTSGSTGKPKGAENRHRGLYNRLAWMQEAYSLDAGDTVLQKTPFGFDVSVWEFFWPLMVGAHLVVAPPGAHRDAPQLIGLIRDFGVTTLHFVPSMLKAFLACSGTETCTTIQRVICSGEALPIEAQDGVFERLPRARLYNLYGPTEAAIDVTHWTCRADGNRRVPIGQPISGTTTWVLDEDMNLVPQGVAGELYLGGAGLARGYLERGSLTAERFVANPLGISGGRLYRTGDRVRWNAQGQLEYLGRLDHQVKIRGFRIELGEIEAQLLAQPEVREAAVLAKEGAAGGRLIAYVSARAGCAIDALSLNERLARTLPDYMVPSNLVVLANLPLNTNGKVDRKALPDPGTSSSREYEEPRGESEKMLAQIWAEVLGVERVGRRDNFFELGGHSLMATMLTSRVRVSLGMDLPLRKIFEHPSLQAMAACLPDLSVQMVDEAPLIPVDRTAYMSLSPAQQRLWLVERMAAGKGSAYNMAAALRLSGALDGARLHRTLNTIVARHEVLRTAYLENGDGDPVAVINEPTILHLPIKDLSRLAIDEQNSAVSNILAEFSARPFDLAHAPLVRALLLALSPTQHLLLLNVHHIAFDGWSSAVFVREFVAIYEALNSGAPPLSPLAIQYADYAVWQSRKLLALSDRNKKFWCSYLDGAPAISTPLADYRRPLSATGEGAALYRKISHDQVAAIHHLAREKGTSAFTVLLAAFTAFLHRCTCQNDLVIGTDVAGRDHPGLENLIGFFVNVVPLRSRFTPGTTFADWLQYTKDSTLSAFEHQEVPLDQIVDYAKVQRQRGIAPLLQVLFVMQNTPQARFEIPGLDIVISPAPVTTSKFDMAIFVQENPDGIQIEWIYATHLYHRETMEKMMNTWNELLEQVVATPETPLQGNVSVAVEQNPDRSLTQGSPAGMALAKAGKLDKLKTLARSGAAAAVNRAPIRTSFLAQDRQFPLVVEATSSDMDAVAWATAQRTFIENSLNQYAAVLFRNFGLRTPQDFEAFAEAIEPELHGSYGDLPKKEGGRNIYQSTPYPERQMILYHNESSHLEHWPRKQWFFCEVPSRIGGATPIVDCREMLRRLPPQLVSRFEEKGLLYVRTFTPRLDVSWRDFYKTDNPAEVEKQLSAAGMEWRWLDQDTLQTRSHSPAVIAHPLTSERVFFNQIQLHHPYCLEAGMRADLLDLVGAEKMPRQVYYGDGTPIDDQTVAEISECYEQCAVRFSWRQGDVALLDNMLVAHARDPFEGERKIVVAMGAMFERTALNSERE